MGAIHQLYATHCTYGSSAIERRTSGDSKDRVLGYSARASSFTQSDLRRHFRTIERFLYYYLPKETQPDQKQTLTPRSAPQRLFFCPSLSGLQALGYISYRQTDCAGRVGSYFAHVLASPIAANEPPWDVLECLQLWNSPGWVTEDRETFPYDLQLLGKLSDLRGGTQPAVDERVLWSFLNTPAGGTFYCPGPLQLPDRWTRMSVDDRQRCFRLALMGYLEVSSKGRESLLLLVEPAVSVLFFYGIARLLPAGLRAKLSFSTFETNADRLVTTLAALTFDVEGRGGEIPPERYRRGFVINTWQDRASELSDPQAKYADFVLASLVNAADASAADLGRAIDQKLARFQQADASKADELEEFVKAHDVAEAILRLAPNVSHEGWKKSDKQTAFVRKAIRQRLSGPAPDTDYLNKVLNSPQYLQLMLETALQADDDDNCAASLKYLVERVQPLDQLDALLGAGGGARRYKLHGLLHYVKTHRRLPGSGPGGCRWLWSEKTPAGRGPHKAPLLIEMLQSSGVSVQVVRDSFATVPDEGLALLFRGLLKAPLDQSDRNDLLTRIAGRPGFDVITLVNDVKSDLATHGALLSSILFAPLKTALDHVHEHPGRFGEITSALDAARSLLTAEPVIASRARAWVDLKATFDKYQKDMASQQQTALKQLVPSGRKVWTFTEEICKSLDRCFPFEQYDAFRRDNFKEFGTFVRQVAATYQLSQLLPEADKFDRYLMAHFRKDDRTKKMIANLGPAAWVREHQVLTGGIVVGAIVLLMALMIVVRNLQERGPVAEGPTETEQGAGAGGASTSGDDRSKSKPGESPATPTESGKPGDQAGDAGKKPAHVDASKSAPGPAQETPPPTEPPKDGTPEKAAEPPGPPKLGGGTPAEGPTPMETVEESTTLPKDAKSVPAEGKPPETAPPAKAPVEAASAEPVSAIQVFIAESPNDNAFENLGPGPFDILHGLDPREVPHRIHGTVLAKRVPLSDGATSAMPTSNVYGELDRIEADFKKTALRLSAKFKETRRDPYPLATLDLRSDGTLSCSLDDTTLLKDGFGPREVLQQKVLRYCVVELRPKSKPPPRFVALIKPVAASFPLEPHGGVHIQGFTNSLRPNVLPWGKLYLGGGKIVHPEGDFEFGQSWKQEGPRVTWAVPKLNQALGGTEDATIELQEPESDIGQVRLSLKIPPPKIDKAVVDEKKNKLGPLRDRKKKIENFVKALARIDLRRPDVGIAAAKNLRDEIKFAEELPVFPARPQEVQLTPKVNDRGQPRPPTAAEMNDVLAQNARRMENYRQEFTNAWGRFGNWIRDKLVPAANTEIASLEEQIGKIEQEFDGAAGQEQKFKEWLKAGVQVQAYIYRLVPYDAPGESRQIRVLVVEPGESVAKPDLQLGTETQ